MDGYIEAASSYPLIVVVEDLTAASNSSTGLLVFTKLWQVPQAI
jgi:hypothetical protein